MPKQRIEWIDLGKGVAMLLVLIGHCEFTPEWGINFIYTFHMPLFFFLSGMVFSVSKYASFREFFIHKAKTLLLPYLALVSILFVWKIFFRNPDHILTLDTLQALLGLVVQMRDTPYYFSLWYVACLFVMDLLLYWVVRLSGNRPVFILVIALAGSLAGYFYVEWIGRSLPWNIDAAFVSLLFFAAGYLLRQRMEKLTILFHWGFLLLAVPANLVLGYLNYSKEGKIDLYYSHLGNGFYYFLSALFGIWASMILLRKVSRCRPVQWIGRNSLIYYTFQNFIALPEAEAIVAALASSGFILFRINSFKSLAAVLIACLLLALISYIINTAFPWVMGRKKEKGL